MSSLTKDKLWHWINQRSTTLSTMDRGDAYENALCCLYTQLVSHTLMGWKMLRIGYQMWQRIQPVSVLFTTYLFTELNSICVWESLQKSCTYIFLFRWDPRQISSYTTSTWDDATEKTESSASIQFQLGHIFTIK